MNDTRLQLHWAAQIAAAVGRTLLSPQQDDSHTTLTWSPAGRRCRRHASADGTHPRRRLPLLRGALRPHAAAARRRAARSPRRARCGLRAGRRRSRALRPSLRRRGRPPRALPGHASERQPGAMLAASFRHRHARLVRRRAHHRCRLHPRRRPVPRSLLVRHALALSREPRVLRTAPRRLLEHARLVRCGTARRRRGCARVSG